VIEVKEKKDRVDDAQHATKAAVEEGILPGGGMAFIRAQKSIDKLLETLIADEKIGANIIKKAMSCPLRQIAKNAGVEASLVIQKVLSLKQNDGYDASTDAYVDMFEKGIVDPTKVVRCTIQFAASIASLLLTTEAIITEDENEKEAQAPMAPPMGY